MFGFAEKRASSIVELLIIMAIVGILSVMYQRAVDKDAILTKYAYKNVISNMNSYAVTKTNSYQTPLPDNICTDFYNMVNTIGEASCPISNLPDTPNLTTTSGLRFFGLGQDFQDRDNDGTPFIIIDVDTDGIKGDNMVGRDILAVELLKSGRIRPSGEAVLTGNVQNDPKNNPARDPQIYATIAYYIPPNVTDRNNYVTMGNRLSFAESQCLTGNIFPYRERSGDLNIQMCVEDQTIRNAINAYRAEANADNKKARMERIRQKEFDAATSDTYCRSFYTDNKSAMKGLTAANNETIGYCQKCYASVFKAKYCASPATEGYDSTMCANAAITAEDLGTCQTKDFIDK